MASAIVTFTCAEFERALRYRLSMINRERMMNRNALRAVREISTETETHSHSVVVEKQGRLALGT